MSAIGEYLVLCEDEQPVVGEFALTIEEVLSGDYDDDSDCGWTDEGDVGDDEVIDVEDEEVSVPVKAPDLVRHDAKYHHGIFDEAGYASGKVKCKYRDAREAALSGKSGEEADLALAGLDPEMVEGEEIDLADVLGDSGEEVSAEEPKAIGRPRRQEADTLGAFRHRRMVDGMSEKERELFRKLMTARVRRSQLRNKPGRKAKEDFEFWDEMVKNYQADYDAYRLAHGREKQSGDSPSAMLISDKVKNLRGRIGSLRAKLKYRTNYEIGKTGRIVGGPDIEAMKREIAELREKLERQVKADRAKLDADESLGVRTIRRCTVDGSPAEFEWSKGRWVLTNAGPRALHVLEQRKARSRALAAQRKENLTDDQRMLEEFGKLSAQISRKYGFEREKGRSLLASCGLELEKDVPSVREFSRWLEGKNLVQTEEEARRAAERKEQDRSNRAAKMAKKRAYLDLVGGEQDPVKVSA